MALTSIANKLLKKLLIFKKSTLIFWQVKGYIKAFDKYMTIIAYNVDFLHQNSLKLLKIER